MCQLAYSIVESNIPIDKTVHAEDTFSVLLITVYQTYHSPYWRKSFWDLQGIWCSGTKEAHLLQDMSLWPQHPLYLQLKLRKKPDIGQLEVMTKTKLLGGGWNHSFSKFSSCRTRLDAKTTWISVAMTWQATVMLFNGVAGCVPRWGKYY